MAKDPAFLFYSADFLTGTLTMSLEHVGMYIRLLCLQHQKGPLSEKDMLYICSSYVEDVYNKFTFDESRGYFNERLEQEAEKRRKYSESRRRNISKRYEATYVEHMENENKDVNTNTNTNTNTNKDQKKKRKKLSDDEWLAELKANAAYSHIDLDREMGKIDAWLSVNTNRTKTRRFVVNWLNRVEKPMEVGHGKRKSVVEGWAEDEGIDIFGKNGARVEVVRGVVPQLPAHKGKD